MATKTAIIIPYSYWNYGAEMMVYVDKDDMHPDPMKKLLWGWDSEGNFVSGDYKNKFTRKGNLITIEYSTLKFATAADEKKAKVEAIVNYLKRSK